MKLGLALSGGGFRASAFHLGILKRLEELNLLQNIKALSTVSGGSIVGALYALRCSQNGTGSPGDYPIDDLVSELRLKLTSNLRGRALFGHPVIAAKSLVSFLTPLVSRCNLFADELDKTFFEGAVLKDLPNWICINATSLRTGKGWKFYNDLTGDYLLWVTNEKQSLKIAEAVAASAAYPVFVDPFRFKTTWEAHQFELTDPSRWDSPRDKEKASRWRNRFGKEQGALTVPLVDGGLYDNEGVVSLRSMNVSHAIVGCAAPSESDSKSLFWATGLKRALDSMHSRLGGVTRQWAHEASHELHPNTARDRLLELSAELKTKDIQGVEDIAQELESISRVGWPPRGRQFHACAQILLHSENVASNWSKKFDPPYDIPESDRGLSTALVDDLSFVRTDLDALEPEVFDLLVAQGYFLADAYSKVAMPEIVSELNDQKDPHGDDLRPRWQWAKEMIAIANSAPEYTKKILSNSTKQLMPLGRCKDDDEKQSLYPGLAAFCILGLSLLLLMLSPVATYALMLWIVAAFAWWGWKKLTD